MAWYEDWFDRAEYELVYQRRDEHEAERVADLIEQVAAPAPEAKILDVGCGRGRHARALTRRGYRVTGLDLSEQAIRTARRRAAQEDLPIDFRQQDMRDPMGEEIFDGAVNLFSSFGYFEHDAEHQQVITRVAEALRPGGFFLQDFMNAPAVRDALVPESTRTERGLQIEEHRWIENDRIEKEITLHHGGDGASDSPSTFRESVRLLRLEDFRRFYQHAGLRLVDTFGDYDGAPHDETSPRLIMLARKDAA